MGLELLLIVYYIFFIIELTLSVCAWRWSCISLHGSRCWCM